MRTRAVIPLLAVALAACGERAPTPMAPASLETHRVVANACPGIEDGCTPVSEVIDVASVDVGDAYIQSSTGRRYHVSFATQFLAVALPPNPVFPNDPIHGMLTSWNALVDSQAGYRAFLGQLRQLPPSPIVPPNPIRFQVEALFDGTDYFLASLRPVLTP